MKDIKGKKKQKIFLFFVFGVVICIYIIYLLYTNYVTNYCAKQYPFLSKNIDCINEQYEPILTIAEKDLILGLIDKLYTEDVQQISVFVRDLNSDFVWGIDELVEFTPASLLKLPLAISVMDMVQNELLSLDMNIDYRGEDHFSAYQRVNPLNSARTGNSYYLSELISMMLRYSDNNSYEVLEALVRNDNERRDARHEVFRELGLVDPRNSTEMTLTVRGYASLFRVLYNASFLNPKYSNYIIEELLQSDYDVGIVAGVPKDIKVANKFGERIIGNMFQLHDCGIVYHKDYPYVVCIMTRGKNWQSQTKVIEVISEALFKAVSNTKQK